MDLHIESVPRTKDQGFSVLCNSGTLGSKSLYLHLSRKGVGLNELHGYFQLPPSVIHSDSAFCVCASVVLKERSFCGWHVQSCSVDAFCPVSGMALS